LNCDSGVSGQIVYDVKDKGVLLAKNFDDDVNIEGWYASEKWDGYRSVWNGKNFVSRTGKSFDVPDWYCSIMPPSIALDGELWLGRGKFEDCGLLRKKRPTKESDIHKWNEEWLKKEVVFNVFDIMNLNVGFEERMEKLRTLVKDRNKCMKQLNINKPNPILAFTEQTKVNKVEALKMAKEVIKDGGEGIMLRQPDSLYEANRSKTLYKIKEVDDMEVVIDGYKNGKGKYINILGSFTCSLVGKPDIKCNVSGMNDEIRNSYLKTHPIGTVITITYNGLTKFGKPRHPRYLRIRHKEGH
jgi:DNA ligase-1